MEREAINDSKMPNIYSQTVARLVRGSGLELVAR
jgi:hypothetical protein